MSWIKCTERQPEFLHGHWPFCNDKSNTRVLIRLCKGEVKVALPCMDLTCNPPANVFATFWFYHKKGLTLSTCYYEEHVTHWQPLPDPPTIEGDSNGNLA